MKFSKADVYELMVGDTKVEYVTLYRLREVLRELEGCGDYHCDCSSKIDELFGEVLE